MTKLNSQYYIYIQQIAAFFTVMLNIVVLSVIMLSVLILNVVAPN
jgi:hypothetical protein